MDNENINKIKEFTRIKIAVSNFQKEDTMGKNHNRKNNYLKVLAAICACFILISGMIFSKDIYAFVKYYFGARELDIAAENGYVEDVDMEPIEKETTLIDNQTENIIEDVNINVKIDEFLMNDTNISMNFIFEFDEKIKDVFDIDNLQFIEINDLIVIDEEKRILFNKCDLETFEEFCQKNNLDYVFGEYNENYIGSSWGRTLREYDKDNNIAKYTYNMYATGNSYPKSKELDFIFTEIKIEKYEEYNGQDIENGEYLKPNSIILKGDWKIHLEVPEKMYNRTKEHYKVVSISNPNFEVYTACVSDTGFEFGTIISNVKQPEAKSPIDDVIKQFGKNSSQELTEEEVQKLNEYINANIEEFSKLMDEFRKEITIIADEEIYLDNNGEEKHRTTSVTNSRGEEFGQSMSSRLRKSEFLEDDKFDFYETFAMTKYDATDRITVTLLFKDEPVYIELEKIK